MYIAFNKFIIGLGILLIGCSTNMYAGYLDSLLNEIKNTKNDLKHQAELYRELSHYYINNDYERSLVYARKTLELAHKAGYNKMIAAAYIRITAVHDHTGEIDKGLATADSALMYSNLQDAYRQEFWAQIFKGELYRRKANYNKAVEQELIAIKIAEDKKDIALLSYGYNSMAILSLNLGRYNEGEEYHLKALEIRKQLKVPHLIAQSLNNLGIVYRVKGDYDMALKYYLRALDIFLEHYEHYQASIAFLYNDIGAAYSFRGDTDKAEEYLKKSIELREEMNELDEIAYTYNYLGENYERKNDLKSAEQYIKKALGTAIQIGNNKQHYEALESLSDFYSRNNMYDSAYSYLKQYKQYRDSIAYMDNKRIISELRTKYETEKKEQQIALQQSELSKKNYFIGGISALLLLGSLLGYSSYRRYRLAQQDKLQKEMIKQQELATKAVIDAEENERKRIAGDLHDGVGQVMSAARMNLSAIGNEIPFGNNDQKQAFEKALALVDEGCKEVRTVSHNIMPNALLKSGLSSAIREFIDKIDQRVLKVNLYTEGLNERLPSNIETVLYRVIQECINNVIKHSGANTLDITMLKDNDEISITIEDNGKGFNTADKKKFDGIGLTNMQTRIDYLRGHIEWDSAPGKGTVITINIPNVQA